LAGGSRQTGSRNLAYTTVCARNDSVSARRQVALWIAKESANRRTNNEKYDTEHAKSDRGKSQPDHDNWQCERHALRGEPDAGGKSGCQRNLRGVCGEAFCAAGHRFQVSLIARAIDQPLAA
jgi:hypothetical protein